ncbi:MAG: hypothetical protein L0312_16525, partial [Acidobacteria bacterium]|nr:hypothetical protein [Acidobacteriota bacterium]
REHLDRELERLNEPLDEVMYVRGGYRRSIVGYASRKLLKENFEDERIPGAANQVITTCKLLL